MTGFLGALKKQYRQQVERHHSLPFLKATMSACALVATADGEVSFTERVRVDQIVETLEELKIFDPHDAANLFRDYCDVILKSPKQGHESVLKDLEMAAGNPETAELLIRICLAVTEANGRTSLVDQIEIVTLCSLLELDPAHFGLYKAELLDSLSA
jgi:tellurite resistance protein TerB